MRMGLRGMKAIEGNMIQAMARLKNPAEKMHQAGFEPRTSGLKLLKPSI